MQDENLDFGGMILMVANKIRHSFTAIHSADLLSPAQGRVLHFILGSPKQVLIQKDIEEEFNIRPSSVSDIIRHLESKGFILRSQVDSDSRQKQILPTQKALEYRDFVHSDMKNINQRLTEGFSENQQKQFYRLLCKMAENL